MASSAHDASRYTRRQSFPAMHSQTGVAFLEFALLLLLLVPAIVLAVEIGRLLHFEITLHNAARSGAQHGIRSAPITWSRGTLMTGVRSAAISDSDGLSGLTVTPALACSCPESAAPPTQEQCSADLGGINNQFYCDEEGPPHVYLTVTTSAAFQTQILPNAIDDRILLSRNVTFRLQ